jgi:hypothetical protein
MLRLLRILNMAAHTRLAGLPTRRPIVVPIASRFLFARRNDCIIINSLTISLTISSCRTKPLGGLMSVTCSVRRPCIASTDRCCVRRHHQDFDDRMPASGRGIPSGRIDRDGQCGTRHRTGSPSRSSNGKRPVARVKRLTTIPVRPAARNAENDTRADPRRTVSSIAIVGRHRDAGLSTSSLWRF